MSFSDLTLLHSHDYPVRGWDLCGFTED